ncbi:hypothetical protein IAG41_09255 [Sphingomonas sp. JC676]|uniref:hypothetical protein n=1 Tax=Sphingomonas sp. JC676 TaxID=2768065 RepID=UPI0016585F17|nr:hypothetical protein [Sphingomonas sp. JC676]MBC9032577.1 hypothetical protein [Sphingomonas sp. JC676]
MRVVQDAATANRNRRSDVTAAASVAARTDTGVANGAAGSSRAGSDAAAARKGLSMLQAGLFLLACVIGGVTVAVLRPF